MPETEAGIRPDNRSYRYGYGLFETMLLRDGRIRLGAYHWERLLHGMDALLIGRPEHFRETLEAEVLRTAERNGHGELSKVRLQVDGGHGAYGDASGDAAGFVIETRALDANVLAINSKGLVLGISDIVKPIGKFSGIKTANALPYALAARQAAANCWDDALLTNEHGNLADSTIANIFWTEGEKIYTPPLTDGCVAGVMRRHILDTLPACGLDVSEKSLNLNCLKFADNVFLSNALRGILWVERINDLTFAPIPDHISRNCLQYT